MLQFTRLRLSGFKSFVEPSELLIEPGMTGVVGPNGCGKSNLVEALRWVMGETSARQMRGSEMDDVIFGGTSSRPKRNLAEVTLHLDNGRRTAPAAFNDFVELEVTRRIERGSGSAYRVNGREVRARDVQLLFADAATGARSTAMVSQGRVGALINARPNDRRLLIEEAAGITGLHSRRHESELRLRAAEQNLERLDDLLATQDGQLASLKRQARQAARYRALGDLIRRTEAKLLILHWRAANARQDAAGAALRQTEERVAEAARGAARAATDQAGAAAACPDLRRLEAEAAAALQRLILARDGLDDEERRAKAAQVQAQGRAAQLARDLDRARALLADARQAASRLEAERVELEAACDDEGFLLAEAAEEAALLYAELAEAEAGLTALAERAAAEEAMRAAQGRRLKEAQDRAARLDERRRDAEAQRDRARAEAVEPLAVESAAQAVEAAALRQEAAAEALEALERRLSAARAVEHAAREAQGQCAAQRSRLKAEADALAAVLKAGDPQGGVPLIDRLTVTPGFEAALAAALGEDLAAPLLEAPLGEAEAGGDVPPVHWCDLPPSGDPASWAPLPPGLEPLARHVQGPPALARRLGAIAVVAEAEHGFALQPGLAPGQRLVSRDGGLWRWDGLRVAAGAPTAAAVRLEQRNRLAGLEAGLEEAELRLEAAESRAAEARAEVDAAREGEQQARDALRGVERAVVAAREAEAALLRRADAAQARLAAQEEALARLDADLAEAREALAEAERAQAELPEAGDSRRLVAEAQARLAERRAAQVQAKAAHERLLREAEDRRRRLETIRVDDAAWRARAEDAQAQIEELEERRLSLEEEMDELAAQPLRIDGQRRALAEEIAAAESRRAQAAHTLAEAESALAEADRALRAAEQALAAEREGRLRAEAEFQRTVEARRALIERIAERLHCTPAELPALAHPEGSAAPESAKEETPRKEETPGKDEDEAALERRLERLNRERDGMGPVNLRAEQEARALETAIDTQRAEREDLILAIAKLRSAIANLNREARERLLAAFQQVDGHFQELFVRLFGGGRAHLALTETDDPLTAGLEIMASPPGKKLQVLSLLSGGEQALTALALLFAVFLCNPAPICVLDEVDAPLDDANVERFCDMVEEMARHGATRFLVITHHRLTMARMDRLFGVTMAERGVSQLVSVDLGGIASLRGAA